MRKRSESERVEECSGATASDRRESAVPMHARLEDSLCVAPIRVQKVAQEDNSSDVGRDYSPSTEYQAAN